MTDETSSETEVKHYYGLVDTENNGWGFVEEGDERITSDFIELTHSQWQELMEAQAEGYEITGYGGKCFAAEKDKYYVDDTGAWQERTDEELETLQEERQAEYYANLTLTAADVERAIYKAKGMDFDDIVEYVEGLNESGSADIDIKALKIELKANNFYRGNDYVEQIGTLLGYSSDDLDYLFENGALPEAEE